MPTIQKKLTPASVFTLPPGDYQDTTTKYLYLYVSALHRSWGYYRWDPLKKQPIRKALGKLPDVDLEAARTAAEDYRKELAIEGGRAKPEKEPKIKALLDDYTAKLKLEKKKQWFWAEDIFGRVYSDWFDRPLSALTRVMIEDRQREITAERGFAAATRALKALRALFNYAEKREVYAGKNTAKLVDLVESEPRRRVLTAAEKAAFLDALNTPEFTTTYVSDFFRLLLLTGVRWGNLCSARWDEMSLDEGMWIIPAAKSKSGYAMEIGLRPEAVDILRKRLDTVAAPATVTERSPWVFPSPKKSSVGHLVEPSFAFARVLEMAEIKAHTTVHDLRRSFGSELVNKNVSLSIVAKALGHRTIQTTQKHYGHVSVDAVKAALAL
ncbi:tyrosine-type recombinase/integrase [Variovorax sp. J22P240]|uniref:tyrosine-type recombinase/integrase n=1 Tax=Variovorax sp. J22P240 TaxID=3053514 RepID=UPI002574B76F|nr:site-specific integrase [Variovorax sp. J22P240]MDM0002220.1 tyrosine-type recombinase/integrase [Variovorax sp. J22P240]